MNHTFTSAAVIAIWCSTACEISLLTIESFVFFLSHNTRQFDPIKVNRTVHERMLIHEDIGLCHCYPFPAPLPSLQRAYSYPPPTDYTAAHRAMWRLAFSVLIHFSALVFNDIIGWLSHLLTLTPHRVASIKPMVYVCVCGVYYGCLK